MALPVYTIDDINEMIYWNQARFYAETDRYSVYTVYDLHKPKEVTGYYIHEKGTDKIIGKGNTSQLNKFLRSHSK